MTLRARLFLSLVLLSVAAVALFALVADLVAPRGSFDDAIRIAAIAAGLLSVALAAPLTRLLAASIAKPVTELTDAARAMGAGDLQRRLVGRNDELGPLAGALNQAATTFAATIAEVTAERNRFAGILAGMVEGVLVLDRDGLIVVVNPALRELLGITGEVAGRGVLEAVRSAELLEMTREVLHGGEPSARTLVVDGREGARTFEIRFSILRNEYRSIAGLVAVFHDVSALKRLEQVRRDFVSNASHELKTPVTAILGATETLVNGALADREAAPRFVDVIARHAARLAALVEDLLDLSRLEARDGAPALGPVLVKDALARAAAPFMEEAAKKRLKLVVEPPPRAGAAVRGDATLLERALTNLVQNAVRYTPAGGRVTLRARDDDGAIRLEVEDTGIGIPADSLPRIFERFYRVDPARSRELGGTGLGLAIVKHAVEAMGGRVRVESQPGRGSTFGFTLPVVGG